MGAMPGSRPRLRIAVGGADHQRGLAEMARLAVALGARPEDAQWAERDGRFGSHRATGSLSRIDSWESNWAKDLTLSEILANMRMVAEGVGIRLRRCLATGPRTSSSSIAHHGTS